MDSTQAIILMIAFCLGILLLIIFSRHLRRFINIGISGALGTIGIYLFNLLLIPFGISVSINLVTILFVGILGIPGFITLYISSWVL